MKLKTGHQLQKLAKPKGSSSSLKKINKTDKTLARLTKKRSEKT